MRRGDRAKAMRDPIHPTPEQRDFLRRRTMPFLDTIGLDRPLSFILEEVYLQGMRDAIQAIEETDVEVKQHATRAEQRTEI